MISKDYTLGIDIGSTTVKIALLDSEHNIVFSDYKRHFANIQETLSDLLQEAVKVSGNVTLHPVRVEFYSKKELDEQLDELRELIDEESQSMITPFLTQRDFYIKEISKNEKVREQLVKDLKVRNQQEELLEKHQVLIKDIETLTERLDALKKNAPSMEGILQGLGDRFSQYLKGINIKNRTGIKISERYYTPVRVEF